MVVFLLFHEAGFSLADVTDPGTAQTDTDSVSFTSSYVELVQTSAHRT